jgi:dienelactone hydrolase
MWNLLLERRAALKLLAGSLATAGLSGEARADIPRVLPADKLPNDRRLRELKHLNGYFPWEPFETYEAWQKRAESVRRQILVALGLWPMPEKAPLEPIIHGKVDRDDYTVEKVIVETHPGLYLTGNLYRPKGKEGKRPGILCPHGHWANGRFHDHGPEKVKLEVSSGAEFSEVGGRHPLQARCVQLARMGCVVLLYDMLGYADNNILPGSLTHGFARQRPDMSRPDRWGLFSAQAELRLINVMGLQTWNSIRAVDFLSSLPDVDPDRIGVTGASGGGTQTFILACVDPRPKAFFPAVMVSTAMQGGCTCENASYLRINTGNIEFAALAAPRPLGMTGANDWTKDIETKGLPQLVEHYARLGAPGRVEAKYFPFEHNYNHPSRLMMYDFFNRHLRLGLEQIVERDYQPLSKEEMSVWNDRHPMPASDDEAELKIVRAFDAAAQRQLQALTPKDATSLAEYRRVVGGAWDILIGRGMPNRFSVLENLTGGDEKAGYREYRALLRPAKLDEEVPVVILVPANWNREVVVWLTETGKAGLYQADGTLNEAIRTLVDSGRAVAGIDLFGQGEFLKPGVSEADAHLVNNPEKFPREFLGYTLGYNHPLFSQRVHDVLTLLAFARDHESQPSGIHLAGFGAAALYAAAAAAQAGPLVKKLAVGTNGYRFGTITDIRDPLLLPGAVKYGDVPGLLSLRAPHPLWVAGEETEGLTLTIQTYAAAGRPQGLQFYPGSPSDAPLSAAKWLLV